MILALLLIPVIAAVLSLIVRNDMLRRIILIVTAISHTAITVTAWSIEPNALWSGWLMLDKPGLLFLTITSVLFLACSFYAFGYLAGEAKSKQQVFEE
jgi:formate hydrogenlyase subunit 3/multisubunit Na+/H+ antiporter MnhD subunit